MAKLVLTISCLYGMTAVILGAFGAHLLKKILPKEKLESFETGVRYQLLHAIVLLVMGLMFDFQSSLQSGAGWCFIIGIALFSFSIYILSFSEKLGGKVKFLGPITPLGGLLMIIGWAMLLVYFFRSY